MNNCCEMFHINAEEGIHCTLAEAVKSGNATVYTFEIRWTRENAESNDYIEFKWNVPMKDILYRWTPLGNIDRTIAPDWCGFDTSMISRNAPAIVFFNGKSEHKYSWALSECSKLVLLKAGVVEESGELESVVRLPLKQFTNCYETTLSVRVDDSDISFSEALKNISAWWEDDLGMTPFHVPDAAKDPVYSFWYSYHQNITDRDIEAECARAKELGFRVCIIDDGWQTDDSNRGYAFCGDWEVTESKIKDMKVHVEAVHKLGMKYIIWYSVPYMGFNSRHYAEYEDMLLRKNEGHAAGILDPRFKKVREFLINIYKTALTEWKLDGFKLDFIDEWRFDPENREYDSRMDIPVLQDAVDAFLTEVAETLREINPDILLEFRQGYIGPNMRKFGNMFRVGDCPNDYIRNRVGVLDLRLMMGNTAVHSDMLMWHTEEKPEIAALQIISILFGVMQYSARLENMSDDMKKMSRFWLNFMDDHRELLLNSELTAYEPHLLYTWAKSSSESECMVCTYSVDKCVKPDCKAVVYAANGSEADRVLLDLEECYVAEVYDCYGEVICSGLELKAGIAVVNVPVGGLAVMRRK